MSGLTFEFVLRHDTDTPHCSSLPRNQRLERINWIRWAPDYAVSEHNPTPAKGVLLGNWNDWSGRALILLEQAGYALEWEDEWCTCDGCGRVVRVQPDSCGWQPAHITTEDGEIYCQECTDVEEYLESLEDDPRKCCFAWIDPEEYGYERVSESGEYEAGLREGQNDRPEVVLKALHAQGVRGVLFRVSDTGQFDVNFETWRRITGESEVQPPPGAAHSHP